MHHSAQAPDVYLQQRPPLLQRQQPSVSMNARQGLRNALGIRYTCVRRGVTDATIGNTLKRVVQVISVARLNRVTDIIPDVRTANAHLGTK